MASRTPNLIKVKSNLRYVLELDDFEERNKNWGLQFESAKKEYLKTGNEIEFYNRMFEELEDVIGDLGIHMLCNLIEFADKNKDIEDDNSPKAMLATFVRQKVFVKMCHEALGRVMQRVTGTEFKLTQGKTYADCSHMLISRAAQKFMEEKIRQEVLEFQDTTKDGVYHRVVPRKKKVMLKQE